MPFVVAIEQAKKNYPEYTFIGALSPSEQKAAFYVKDDKGNDLCLKIISPDYPADRLAREVLALQVVNHPNVARFREYTCTCREGLHKHHIVEEFIVGDDLSVHLQQGKPWPRPKVSRFFAALCDGLWALHAKGLVHRDLKPSNVRVRPDGTPVIIDLGVVRHLYLPAITSTSDGARFGTPSYFAPEQFAGTKHDIDTRTDLFAIGVLLYQALVGRHPFWQANMTASLSDMVCHSHDHLAVPEFNALPKEWRLTVSKLLEKDRANRPQRADQVAHILRKLEGV